MEEGEGKIRSFVAVDLAPAVAAHVRDFLAACRALKGDIRWVRAEGLHVTLKFLGWTPADIV